MQRNYAGDILEKQLFEALKKRLLAKNEEFALFHGSNLYKLDLNNWKNDPHEKDFILISLTHKCVFFIEVKRTLDHKHSLPKAKKQLEDSKEKFESWFHSELSNDWKFVPLIFGENLQQTLCDDCDTHIIIGMYKTILIYHNNVFTYA